LSYWTCVVARNAASHLAATINSLLNQSLRPRLVVVVDDGSTDATADLLADYRRTHPRVFSVLTLPDLGYDIRRVPRNINLACVQAKKIEANTDYFMISGDDCIYPRDYSRSLVLRMESKQRIVVASGGLSSGIGVWKEHSPIGSGRMVRWSFWQEIGGAYPVKAGWETWLLYKALEEKYEVMLFKDLIFEHKRPRGAKHQFVYWGAAMHALGYHPLYAIGRTAKNVAGRSVSVRGSFNMLRGYLQARLGSSDTFMAKFEESLRQFVRRQQLQEIVKIVRTLFG
jgi:biofilm PGA synthesis N-glycosyltransferase PgaC